MLCNSSHSNMPRQKTYTNSKTLTILAINNYFGDRNNITQYIDNVIEEELEIYDNICDRSCVEYAICKNVYDTVNSYIPTKFCLESDIATIKNIYHDAKNVIICTLWLYNK